MKLRRIVGALVAGLFVLGLGLVGSEAWIERGLSHEEIDARTTYGNGTFLILFGALSILTSTLLGWFGLCLPLAWARRVASRREVLRAAWLASLPSIVIVSALVTSRRWEQYVLRVPPVGLVVHPALAGATAVALLTYLAALLWRVTRT